MLWTYVVPPPFQNGPAAAFAIVAVVIGVIAGLVARSGWMRPRTERGGAELAVGALVAFGVVAGLAYYAYTRFIATFDVLQPRRHPRSRLHRARLAGRGSSWPL